MTPPRPDLATLSAALAPAGLRAVRREPSPQGNARIELVVCADESGVERTLFAKYDDPGEGTVAYEARIYADVLEPLGQGVAPRLFACSDEPPGWILLACVEGQHDYDDPFDERDALLRAAVWLGEFHRACDERLPLLPEFVRRQDSAHYRALLARSIELAPDERAWLLELDERLDGFVGPLFDRHATIVHADFSPDNMVFLDGRGVCVLDWEDVAVDLGEHDLAYLTWGQASRVVSACVDLYAEARWPSGAPAGFPTCLAAAQLCLELELLPTLERPVFFSGGARRVRAAAQDLGLVERNVDLFDQELRETIARLRREGGAAALLLIDLDRVGRFVQIHGQDAANELDHAVQRVLSERVRGVGVAAHLGSDEFAALVHDADGNQAKAIGAELNVSIRSLRAFARGQEVGMTASIGIVALDGDTDATDAQVFAAARIALEQAKSGGRDRSVLVRASGRRA